jgi:hypothetical protein
VDNLGLTVGGGVFGRGGNMPTGFVGGCEKEAEATGGGVFGLGGKLKDAEVFAVAVVGMAGSGLAGIGGGGGGLSGRFNGLTSTTSLFLLLSLHFIISFCTFGNAFSNREKGVDLGNLRRESPVTNELNISFSKLETSPAEGR